METMVLRKKNRRSLRINKRNSVFKNVKFVGLNAAGLSSKLDSFDGLLANLQPSVFFVQETKFKRNGKLKSENTSKYHIYERIRKDKTGGGIAIGISKELDPVWIREGKDNIELLTVEINLSGFQVRCVCGYGPQENDPSDKKQDFWDQLSVEVEDAINLDVGLVIQMDGNLWAGKELIKEDPNQINNYGKLFKTFLDKYKYLYVVNAMSICQGVITRSRETKLRSEKSVLDFFIVCYRMKQFIERMVIDEDKQYALAHYFRRKGINHKIYSDHNPLILDIKVNMSRKRNDRIELFNFRSVECQEKFLNITNKSEELIKCFNNKLPLNKQCNQWFKELNGIFHQSFRKLRFNGKTKETEVSRLLKQKNELKQKNKLSEKDENQDILDEIEDIEKKLAELVAKQNSEKVKKNFGSLSSHDSNLNVNGMWALKKRIFPKNPPNLPEAKKDINGKIITSHKDYKNLYLDSFVHRLRWRPIRDEYEDLFKLKEQLFEMRLQLSKLNKSPCWTEQQLNRVLASLKDNKSRDPHGIINELFKPGVGGKKLVSSLLIMLNKIKQEITIPEFMELSNIVSIYKGKGERMDLQNDRGIFIMNIFRSLLMKMVYRDNYAIIDKSMSDSNVGARKKKNIRNHIFIINGIINEAIQNKSNIDVQILDYRQCFDSMWLKECINDLYNAGVTDDSLALIFEANKKNQVAVKTPVGLTQREMVEEIVLQGEVFGPLQCSVQVDTFGKECLAQSKHLYSYRNCVGIPPLAMIDDLLAVSECGVETVKTNAYLNAKTNVKKLQFGGQKCHKLHVGKNQLVCPDLYVDGWKLEKVDQFENGITNLKDVFEGDFPMEEVEDEKYLGDIV